MENKPITVMISGKMRSGKDTACQILQSKYLNLNFQQLELAKEVKRITANVVGLTVDKLEELKDKYRPNIIYTGQVGRELDSDTWIKRLPHPELFHGNSIITDIRFKNEFFYFNSLSKTNTIFKVRVKADDKVRIRRGADLNLFGHPSETDLDDIADSEFDVVIENNEDLIEFKNQLYTFFDDKFM